MIMIEQAELSSLIRFERELRTFTDAPGSSANLQALAVHWRNLREELSHAEERPKRDCPSCGRATPPIAPEVTGTQATSEPTGCPCIGPRTASAR